MADDMQPALTRAQACFDRSQTWVETLALLPESVFVKRHNQLKHALEVSLQGERCASGYCIDDLTAPLQAVLRPV